MDHKEIWNEAYQVAKESGLSEQSCRKVAEQAVQGFIDAMYARAEHASEEARNG